MARSKLWGATSILAGVLFFFNSFLRFVFFLTHWDEFFFFFFSPQENIGTGSVLFIKGLEHFTTTYRATTTEQTEQLKKSCVKIQISQLIPFSSSSFLDFAVFSFALCSLLFDF